MIWRLMLLQHQKLTFHLQQIKWELGTLKLNILPSFLVLVLCHGTKYSSVNTANDLWELVRSVNQCMSDTDDLFCYCAFHDWNTASVLKWENETMKVWPLTRSKSHLLIWSLFKVCVGSCRKEMKQREQMSEWKCAYMCYIGEKGPQIQH